MTKLHDAEQIAQKLEATAKHSKILYILLIIIFIAYIAIAVAIFALIAVSPEGFLANGTMFLLEGIPLIISLAIGGAILFTVARVFGDLSKKESPFTDIQARRIAAIGLLLLTNAVIELLISLNGPLLVDSAGMTVGFVNTAPPGSPYINMTFVIAALICFCLSYVFRYGSLLQWLSDETV